MSPDTTDPTARLNAALEGRYRIERELGEGGMATVYLADDLKHNRKVAIKVLKPELAAVVGAERFLAEIEVTAGLQHPHILPLFDSGQAGAFLYFVMPYIEGETLQDRIERDKQLPVDEAVGIASAVASALSAAHESGVVHRDIKPGNILLSRGEPLVADFGISLAVTNAGGNRLTETGLSMGTPFYMSPEQATGDREVGVQSDVYALGCVLYEMLVGEPPYVGNTAQAVLGKILTEKPRAPTAVRAAMPLNVEGAVLKALEKLPADRFATVADFAKALADPGFRYGVAAEATSGAAAGPGPWKRVALALGITTLLAGGGLTALLLRPSPPQPVSRYAVQLPTGHDPGDEFGSNVAAAPDGSSIVYVGPTEGGPGQQLWLRRRDQLLASPVAGTLGAQNPAFSPDGRRIVFFVNNTLKTVSLGGEPPLEILGGGAEGLGVDWGADGYLYFATGEGIARVRETRSEPELVVPIEPPEVNHAWPHALPGGRGVLFSTGQPPFTDPTGWTIGVFDSESSTRRTLLQGAFARYSESGHVIYVAADGTLLAAPFDLGSLELTGDPVALAGGVGVGPLGSVDLDVGADGTLAYTAGGAATDVRPVWVSRQGIAQPVDPSWSGPMDFPSLSPDGTRMAVDLLTEVNDIWIKQLDAGPALRLTLHPSGGSRATWTPGGDAVTFYSARGGDDDLWTRRADGSAQAELTLDVDGSINEGLWSPDGRWLVYRISGGAGIYAVQPSGGDEPVALVATQAGEFSPTLSPDGRYMAFTSNETGRHEVYVVPFPDAASARWAVSTGGGRTPRWSRAGDEIFFLDDGDNMVSVPLETEPSFRFGAPEVLFSTEGYKTHFVHPQFDVTADGQRFLMLERITEQAERQLVIVENFFEVLREQVGEGGRR